MAKSTPEERIAQIKRILQDDDVESTDKLLYFYHAIMLEWGFWRRKRNDIFVKKHGKRVNEIVDIVLFVQKLDNL